MTTDAVPVCRFGDAPLTIEDVVALAELGLLERTDAGGVVCPFASLHIDMHLKAA